MGRCAGFGPMTRCASVPCGQKEGTAAQASASQAAMMLSWSVLNLRGWELMLDRVELPCSLLDTYLDKIQQHH